MTNKTITLDRELVSRIVGLRPDYTCAQLDADEELVRAALAEPTTGIDHETMRARYTDPEAVVLSSGTGSTLRVVVAEPVPPAGGEPEVVGYRCRQSETEKWHMSSTPAYWEHQPVILLEDHRAHVTRLQAEVERLKERDLGVELEVFEIVCKERDALQSELTKLGDDYCKRVDELTKARELLAEGEYYGPARWQQKVAIFLQSNQSAPADKAPPLIQALHANGDRIAMEATIAQQAQRIADLEGDKGQGEPVAWSYCPECGCEELHHEVGEHKQCANCHQEWFSDIDYSDVVRGNLQKLRADQPAPVAVVMPDFDTWYVKNRGVIGTAIYKNERKVWSACLDELARLNSEPKP